MEERQQVVIGDEESQWCFHGVWWARAGQQEGLSSRARIGSWCSADFCSPRYDVEEHNMLFSSEYCIDRVRTLLLVSPIDDSVSFALKGNIV
jgi:hypothetical protein